MHAPIAPAAETTLPELTPPLSTVPARERASQTADIVWLKTLADNAVQAGFFPIAEAYYRQALAQPGLDAETRRQLGMGFSTALIAQAKTEEAKSTLDALGGGDDAAWLVRRGAVDWLGRDFGQLATRLAAIVPDALTRADRGWFHFLQAMAYEQQRQPAEADAEFESALASTASAAQAAVFRLAQFRAKMLAGEATEAMVAQVRRSMDEHQGSRVGYQFTLTYAALLDTLGRAREAIAILTRQRSLLPTEEVELRDQTLLLLGLIAGADSPDGRTAFRELLINGNDRLFQRAALLRLAAGQASPGGLSTSGLRQLYDDLLARTPAHPLYEDLLFYRAELLLRNRDFVRAEEDIDSLLTRYPGTALRPNALALLASSSWLNERYRNAANYVAQLQEATAPRDNRAALAVLLGECYYRAGMQTGAAEDFRNAAEAYGAAEDELGNVGLSEGNGVVTPGTVFFQHVLALIRSGNPDAAAALLDDPSATARVDAESRWQAEWNLVRFLQANGRNDDAFRRVESLGIAMGVPAELRLRFLWLSAQLSLEIGLPADTAERVARVLSFLESADGQRIEGEVRSEVASNAALLGAQARLATGDTEGGIGGLDALRADYPGSRAALYSFIVQARYLAKENQLVDAQRLLTNLADTYRDSEYAPLALYEAALQAERRGQDAYLVEAGQLLERLANDYPQERYRFPARLKQADILRRLNQFAAAELIYENLENAFPNHPDRAFVQLSLAETLMAQSASDPARFEGAITRLERLAVLPTAKADLRAEAGFKLAYAWQVQGNPERASQLYWEVYERFMGDATRAAELGSRGRYWVARTLFYLGELEERAARLDNARRAYEAVLNHGLPGEKLARGRLGRFTPPSSG